MYKVKRLLISPYIGRGCRSVVLACLVNLALWSAIFWRSLGGHSGAGLLPPLAERHLGYLRRSRHLAQYLDEDASPLISPQSGACSSRDRVPVVVLVSSAPSNVEQRAAIRATWGAETPTYFFMGRAGSGRINLDEQMVENYIEAKQHGDLVVGDYLDSYENLTLKTSHMLQWSLRSCPHADFLMKTDDDVLVNPWMLQQLLNEHAAHTLVGYKKNSSAPHRDRENKWYLPRWLYRDDLIPEYLSGTGYLISGDHIRNIHDAAYKVPLINLEDVYLTYLVAKQNLGLTLTHEPRLSPYQPLVPSGCAFWRLASVHSLKPEQILNIWPKIRALAEQYQENGEDPCSVFDRFFGFLSWEMFLV